VWLVDMMGYQDRPVVIDTKKYYDAYRRPLTPQKKLQWLLGHRAAWADFGVALIA
jgi:hypothetical protein